MHLEIQLSKDEECNRDTKETSITDSTGKCKDTVASTKETFKLDNTAQVNDSVSELDNITDQQPQSIIQRIFSSLYCTYLIWFAFGYFRYIYFIGTLNNTLERITNENKEAGMRYIFVYTHQ